MVAIVTTRQTKGLIKSLKLTFVTVVQGSLNYSFMNLVVPNNKLHWDSALLQLKNKIQRHMNKFCANAVYYFNNKPLKLS